MVEGPPLLVLDLCLECFEPPVGDDGSIEGEGMNREPGLESSECDSIGLLRAPSPR